MNATAITRFLTGPAHQANNSVINATATAYSCMLDLSELDLRLTGRIELDADAPIVWIDPPQDPVHLFGRYAIVSSDYHRKPRRIGSVYYRKCHVRWPLPQECPHD